jgi:alkylation response protein AidB-like acyl-CoA dehydrogenase
MDFEFNVELADADYLPGASALRERIRALVARTVPPDWQGVGALPPEAAQEFTASWRRTLYENGLLGIAWPKEYGGGGMDKIAQLVLVQECARARVPVGEPGDTLSMKLFGNTLVRWGTEQQKRRFLRRILTGADVWCQGYSEPDAGSDLASVRTRAVLSGDEWVVNGQKIWTSNAMKANWIFALVRTNPDAPRHKGISFLMVPMDQPGIEVRPITMLNGLSDFCEVFFTDARTARENVLGPVDEGWTVATSLLSHERGEEAASNPVYFQYELDRLVALAQKYGRDQDPSIRRRLAWCHTQVFAMRALGERILEDYVAGGTLGPEASVSKLFWSEYHKRAAALAIDIMGLRGLEYEGDPPQRWFRTDEPGAPNSTASWHHVYLRNAMSGTVYAGTSQIQRNIIAEQALGLPREPR